MQEWKAKLQQIKREMRDANSVTLTVPPSFNFRDHDAIAFDKALGFFDWSLHEKSVRIDLRNCASANYQTLALVVLYAWRLKSNGCHVEFDLDEDESSASHVWKMMGAPGLFGVAFNPNQNFRSHEFKPLVAIRDHNDFKSAIEKAEDFSQDFNIEYRNTLRYVLSELLYNTLEHGSAFFDNQNVQHKLPSLIQFTWYLKRDELQFIIADVGIGVRRHLSQTYSGLEDDEAALRKAIQPQTSGTFARSDPYSAKNNAGMGLYLSTNIVRRLRANMHIVSGHGVLHVSPTDVTTHPLVHRWPGTFALVNIELGRQATFNLHAIMSEFRQAAEREQKSGDNAEKSNTFYLHIGNYFGPYPEDKSAAINIRDKYLLLALDDTKKILLDFEGVESSPHSFLNALLASVIKRLGVAAYKRIKVINAKPEIRETIDFVLDDNTSGESLNFEDG